MKYGVPFIAVQGLKKAWLLKTDQCCLGWGNMEHTVAPLRLTWGFGIPVGSKLKWPQGMESHWARLIWEYSTLFQHSLVMFKVPDPQIVFCQRSQKTKPRNQTKPKTKQTNKTKRKSRTATTWLVCSLGVEEGRANILKTTWAQPFLNLIPWCYHLMNDHLRFWKCRYSGLPSVYSDLTHLGSLRYLDF